MYRLHMIRRRRKPTLPPMIASTSVGSRWDAVGVLGNEIELVLGLVEAKQIAAEQIDLLKRGNSLCASLAKLRCVAK